MLYITKRQAPLGCIYKVIKDKDILYAGPVLTNAQIDNLKTFGNTTFSKSLYDSIGESVGEEQLLKAIKELVGFKCVIDIYRHENNDSVIIRKEVKSCLDE